MSSEAKSTVSSNERNVSRRSPLADTLPEEKKESVLETDAPKQFPDTPSSASQFGWMEAAQLQVTPTVTPEKQQQPPPQSGASASKPAFSPLAPPLPSPAAKNEADDASKKGMDVDLENVGSSEVSELGEFSPRTPKVESRVDDDDSSNDESSYFADPNNLPSPKSSRQYSHSSLANNSSVGRDSYHRESDASLSLSDDSEDEGPQFRVVPELYPHPITRMHSVSSLVSTSSQYSSDQEELRGVPSSHPASRGDTPSGRNSPVRFFASTPSGNPQPSPPTILAARPPPQEFLHPQPHLMHPQFFPGHPPYGFADSHFKESPLSKESIFSFSEDSASIPSRQASMDAAEGGGSQQQQRGFVSKTQGQSSQPHQPSDSAQQYAAQRIHEHTRSHFHREEADDSSDEHDDRKKGFKVYWMRWVMLMYMSALNLLSDWTCYSVAPIAVLTEEAFGNINAEQLVVVFLCANGIATACEPIILSRLGLRRTIVFGALLLMAGSIIKSGGMPPIIQANLEKGHGEWRVYLGFFLVGLSQPLYQCTPALLSASWFPENERTMATGVALNANQVGIGFAFIFGTLLVETSDDIPAYFSLLSIISTITFIGTLLQFADAPPTPPSDTAKVVRGTLEVGLPSMQSIFNSVRNITSSGSGSKLKAKNEKTHRHSPVEGASRESSRSRRSKNTSKSSSHKRSNRSAPRDRGQAGASSTTAPHQSGNVSRRRSPRPSPTGLGEEGGFHGLAPAPSPARWGRVRTSSSGDDAPTTDLLAPSPMMPGRVGPATTAKEEGKENRSEGQPTPSQPLGQTGYAPNPFHPATGVPYPPGQEFPLHQVSPGYPMQQPMTPDESNAAYGYNFGMAYPGYSPYYPQAYWDPRYQQYMYYPSPYAVQQQNPYYQQAGNPYYYYSYQNPPPPAYMRQYENPDTLLPVPTDPLDVGAEPVLMITPYHLDIDIRDDQIIRSTRACLSRPGFIHALVSFTVSGIVINTLSTFMDYLVRLNGVGREYTGIVGGSFQFVIMISSLIVGQFTDRTRAYYSVAVCMLVLGAFGLAECGVNLDSDRGVELRWSLVIVAALVGPLQPVSTELGVDVVYPLSENTVLVIQQLFSNLLSAAFIPCFKALRDFGGKTVSDEASEQPQYTFSFYVLIVLHATATVFFATFNGRYLRYEHELEKKAVEEAKRAQRAQKRAMYGATQPPFNGGLGSIGLNLSGEQEPLVQTVV